MSDPLHAANCPCLDTSKHNPRALPGVLPVPPKPEPLYPRGPDNTSDDTDAVIDGLRARVAELEAGNDKLTAEIRRMREAVGVQR